MVKPRTTVSRSMSRGATTGREPLTASDRHPSWSGGEDIARFWSDSVPTWVHRLVWPLAAVIAALIVGLIQIRDRAPLVWDESFRMSQGLALASFVRDGQWGAAWNWMNAQTFYPFLLPMVHSVIFIVTGEVMASAWLPGLLGYTLAGLLAGRLAVALGAGATGAWASALLVWLIPLGARLAAGGFTEPLGSALLLALALLLVRISQEVVNQPKSAASSRQRLSRPSRRGRSIINTSDLLPVAIGLTIVLAWFLKYDYGLLAAGATSLTVLVTVIAERSLRVAKPFIATGLALAIPVGVWLTVNASKWTGIRRFVEQAAPREGGSDPFYYAQSLFGRGGVSDTVWLGPGLAPGIALLFVGGLLWACWKAWRVAAFRGPVILVVLWYLVYSAANWQDPRYFATILPIIAALAGTALGYAVYWYRTHPHSPSVKIGGAVLVAVFATQIVQQIAGAAGFTTQATFLRPNEPASEALNVAVDALKNQRQRVVMIGHPNEVSQHAVAVAWSERLGRTSPGIYPIPEPGTAQSPGPASPIVMLSLMRRTNATFVLGLDIREGSRLYTEDFVERWPSQPKYIQIAHGLEQAGILRQVSNTELENGHLAVIVWELNRQLLGPRPTFTGTVPGGVDRADLVLDPPIQYHWPVVADSATGAFSTTTPGLLPPGSYTLVIGQGGERQTFTVAKLGDRIPINGTIPGGKKRANLFIEPKITIKWTTAVDPTTGAFASTPPEPIPPGLYSLLIDGETAMTFVITGA